MSPENSWLVLTEQLVRGCVLSFVDVFLRMLPPLLKTIDEKQAITSLRLKTYHQDLKCLEDLKLHILCCFIHLQNDKKSRQLLTHH